MPCHRFVAALALACVLAIPCARPRDPVGAFLSGLGQVFQPGVVTRKKKVVTRNRPAVAEIRPAVPKVVMPNQNVVTEQTGVASWYGQPFHGRKTASGVTYDMEAPMCAHRRMAFGTLVHITNLSNGKTATCRIVDRGPFVAGREIDVSHLVAAQLGMLKSGVARVSIGEID